MALVWEELEASIAELTKLLEFPDVVEGDFQNWFERYPVVFDVLGYRRSIPHPELRLPDSKKIPDFIAQRPDGVWEIFELKLPDTAVLKNPDSRTAFYSDMNTYVSQCHEYSERCSDSYVAQTLLTKYGILINARPDSTLIAGRSEGLDRLKVHGLLSRCALKIRHFTYDDVLDALQQHYVSNFSGNTGGHGISIYACIYLQPKISRAVEFLFDLGHSTTHNRISLSRFGDTQVTFLVIDDSGLRSSQDINMADHCDGRQFFCAIHVTHTATSALVLFEVNGTYVGQFKLAKGSLVLTHPLAKVVGADMEGLHCASIVLGIHMARCPALNVVERETVREYLFYMISPTPDEEVPPQTHGLQFREGQFMYSEGHPILDAGYPRTTNLVQRVNERRPTWEFWPS